MQKGSDGMMDWCLPQTRVHHHGDLRGDVLRGDDDDGAGDFYRCLPQTRLHHCGDDDGGHGQRCKI